MADDEEDVRQGALLRYQFQKDTPFATWSYLLSTGWKYNAGKGYQAPNSDSWMSSIDVLCRLDEAAIAPLDNYLQLPPNRQPANEWSEQLRKEVINVLPTRELSKAMQTSSCGEATADSSNDNDDNNSGGMMQTRNQQPNTKKVKSATTFDAGADLFLRQPKKKKRTLQLGESVTEMEFPTPRQIAEYYGPILNLQGEAGNSNNQSRYYCEWKFLLSTNHSLLLYGFGSKQSVLNDFWKTCLEPVGDVLSIDGFDRSIHVNDILDLMVEIYLTNKEPDMTSTNTNKRAMAIGKAISTVQLERKRPLYLVIHNIDGFRNREAQHALSLLLTHSTLRDKVRTIRLVTSVDHVSSSALLWDPETTFNFDFIWKEVHTYKPYIEELKRGMEQIKDRHGKRAKNAVTTNSGSICDVLYTIAPRHTEVLQTLATMQLKQNTAILFTDFYKACVSKFLVISDATLREYMTELLDHTLMEKTRDGGGKEWLKIPHTNARLQDILDFDHLLGT